MTGQSSQPNPADCLDPYNSLSFQLFDNAENKSIQFPVVVKNITTVGVILEILHLDDGLKPESLKGCEGLFTITGHNDCVTVKVPGKILWTRNREGDSGITLGLELLEPLPLPVRHTLEADMAIGAKDMKVLWDYWDEIQESAGPAPMAEPVEPAAMALDNAEPQANVDTPVHEEDNGVKGNGMYWVGFGAILSGLAMQFPQSEYLGFSGIIVMFLGSMVVAWKSLSSMRQVSSSSPAD